MQIIDEEKYLRTVIKIVVLYNIHRAFIISLEIYIEFLLII